VRQEAADRFKKSLAQFVQDNCDDDVSFKVRTGKKLGRNHKGRR